MNSSYIALFIASMAVLGLVVGVVFATDKWDGAIAIRVCGGLPVLQRKDGTIWLRYRWRAYQVMDLDKICNNP